MKFKPVSRMIASALIVFVLFSFTLTSVKKVFDTAETISPAAGKKRYTLIIDPGHGGVDGGAISVSGTPESGINLAISEKMELIAAFFGEKPVLTRRSDEIIYPGDATSIHKKKVADQRARVELINSVKNAFLISIHQNKYTSPGPSGAQTFFTDNRISEGFAQHIQSLLTAQLDAANKRPAVKMPRDIYLMKNIACPAVLIECGFLSNPGEAALLEDGSYQLKTAMLITGGYLGYTQ